ncbi:MAG: DUF4199 domain-containing protein [Bacteroidales bacterium]|jgi:hypothetical protein|nr:DUF4199 domain-containing protein [Bacteroidales bacterium]
MAPLHVALKHGLITGLALIAYTVVMYVLDMNLFSPVYAILNGLITFGLMIFMAVWAINKTRDTMLLGKINFLQAWLVGAVALVVAFFINSIFSVILNEYIDPSYMTKQLDNFIYSMEGKVPEETLETMIDSMEENMDPMKAFIKGLWMTPLISIVLGAILALFVKKDKSIQL